MDDETAAAIDRIDPPGRAERLEWDRWVAGCRDAFAKLKKQREGMRIPRNIEASQKFASAINKAWLDMKNERENQ